MPMNNRLFVPRRTLHPEALAWRAAVVANGGSVTSTELNAVSQFCKTAEFGATPFRSVFYRLSLLVGGLNGALVPLFRGPSRTGTQYGSATDTNAGFVSGDYSLAAGLNPGASNTAKYLDTGFPTNTLAATSRSLMVYALSNAGRTFDTAIGSEASSGSGAMQFSIGTGGVAASLGFGCFNTTSDFCFATLTAPQVVIGTTTGSGGTANAIYFNGVSSDTGAGTLATPDGSTIYVAALNRSSTPAATEHYAGRLGAYGIGLQVSAAQAAAITTALQAFAAAIGRS